MIKIVVYCSLGVLIGILLFLWLVRQIRYRIGSRHVKVILFGIALRRVALANIETVSKRCADGWSEHWWSTMKPKHRMLVLRRRRGLFKNFVITPRNRYVFKTDLERALRRVAGGPRDPSSDAVPNSPEPSNAGNLSATDTHPAAGE